MPSKAKVVKVKKPKNPRGLTNFLGSVNFSPMNIVRSSRWFNQSIKSWIGFFSSLGGGRVAAISNQIQVYGFGVNIVTINSQFNAW